MYRWYQWCSFCSVLLAPLLLAPLLLCSFAPLLLSLFSLLLSLFAFRFLSHVWLIVRSEIRMVAIPTLLRSSPVHKQEPIPMASPDHHESGFRKVYNSTDEESRAFQRRHHSRYECAGSKTVNLRVTEFAGLEPTSLWSGSSRLANHKYNETSSSSVCGLDDAGCGNSREESRTVRFLMVALHYRFQHRQLCVFVRSNSLLSATPRIPAITGTTLSRLP